MNQPSEGVLLSQESELERLWQGAQDAFGKAEGNIVCLSEAVDLGVRMAELMVVQCLQPVRKEFPATITSLLEPLPPEVDPQRDFLHAPKSLRFVDALDLLSAVDLPCVSPGLHHGWEDKDASCRRSRTRTREAVGISLDDQQRNDLILIGAYRNRIFLLPPPLRIIPEDVIAAFPTLLKLVEQFFSAGRMATD